jgi:distribution and morphology protein 31
MSQREAQGQERREVTVDIDLRFRDLKAAVPMFTSDLSVTNNALIRPILAFIK